MKRIIILGLFSCILFATTALAKQSWNQFVQGVRAEALAKGIRPEVFDEAFAGIKPKTSVIKLDRTQPEKRISFNKYRRTRADAYRIKLGVKAYQRYHSLLDEIGATYGVDPSIIISIWGLESSYGKYMGRFPVIQSLATLAYDARRSDFFRKELLYALEIVNDGHISLDKFKGEWAGGTGQPQFLPSSWHRFAVDYDRNGTRDIWTSHADIFASIANYMAQNGWRAGEPWGVEVTLPSGFSSSLVGLSHKKTVSEWERIGVQLKRHAGIQSNLSGSIIRPDGGPDLLVFHNFSVIRTYNPSFYYAGTVGYMMDKLDAKIQSKYRSAERLRRMFASILLSKKMASGHM